MNITQEMCENYVDRGLLNRNVDGDYTLYCYSKETFFRGHWDHVTKSCRGLVFYKGKPVNHPFPKIFNLDETTESSYQYVEALFQRGDHYVVCHKVNGHLTIVDYIPETDEFLVHTKGSLQDNEMNQIDRDMFFNNHPVMIDRIRHLKCRCTFMFESIHESDPHTLYDQEVARYGKNRLVFLGGYFKKNDSYEWKSLYPSALQAWTYIDNQPCVNFGTTVPYLDAETINKMFAEQDTEGYVIWFTELDFRVKIKTTDYWKMRFRKELDADSIIEKFVAGGSNRLWTRYPEEVADKVVELISEYFDIFFNNLLVEIPNDYMTMTPKEVGLSEKYTKLEKTLIFPIINGKVIESNKFMSNQGMRLAFKEFMDNNEVYKVLIKDSLIQYIEKREV